mgnify:CR=1 FL=1
MVNRKRIKCVIGASMSENEKAANSGKKECSADQADYAIDQVEHKKRPLKR